MLCGGSKGRWPRDGRSEYNLAIKLVYTKVNDTAVILIVFNILAYVSSDNQKPIITIG